ncbi:hypothetical protein HBI16_147860 [Parastagonospora nodorum]|nr:hypothetical protein HBH52_200250 [Parastagonospora nodorum]KAH5382688.1 hypothetical protein HBI33_125260 [Parastagonospora nodorum]KAH5766182.1 hypothetical protein HBI16_147860 [Parastagonospora nodorum]
MERDRETAQLALPVDVHVEIFLNVLQDPRFQAWKQTNRRWQLHIGGGPGSGKTTLAALIAKQLRREEAAPVALIHVHDDDLPTAKTETSLQYHASTIDRPLQSNKFINHDRSLKTEAINISSSGIDFEDLYAVLVDHLTSKDGVYFIIDGHDRFEKSMQERLRQNIGPLEAQGLKLLLLNAASELDSFPPAGPVECDNCKRGSPESEEEDGLQIYWSCESCPYDLCDNCRNEGKHCYDDSHVMSEPYNMIQMRLDLVPSALRHFVRTDLEAEYGDEIEENVIETVCEPSDSNINLAKLRLDQIRDLGGPRAILSATDRLPREVVAFFDAEIKRINVLEPAQRYQTLLAIIMVAAWGPMTVNELENVLSGASSSRPDYTSSDHPFVRRVIRSARGLLSSYILRGTMPSDQQEPDRRRITLYIRDLGWYIREDYNQDLVLAKQYLSQARAGERNLDRSHSFEKTVDARKEDSKGPKGELLGEQSAREGLSEVSGKSVVDAILREPASLCVLCQNSIFRVKSNSGVRTWVNQDQDGKCPVCVYAYKEMAEKSVNVLDLHWSRRTMGRTSNSNDHLVLTLRADNSNAKPTFRRFVFMLKSELGFSPSANNLGATTTLQHTGAQIKKWLDTCNTGHIDCKRPNLKPYVPKRLVDIDTGIIGHYRVIEREKKEEGPYVTLSHSWGREPTFLRLTTENKTRLMGDGFTASDLGNKNFEQAIEVAQHIGMKYIWIDSLCICQAGKDRDFREEGQYMHLVYQNSYCNIVAADSRDGEGGLFRDRPDNLLSGMNVDEPWVVLDKELWAKDLLRSPIYTRGWVFQERMLSPRIIHFTRPQVFWDCSTISACETLPEGLPFALSATATTDRRWRGRLQRKNSDQDESSLVVEDSLESFWKTAVLNYTSCELTNQADKAFAIWSVAKLVRDNLQPVNQYGCGLWSIALHEQLAWQVKALKPESRMASLQAVFPSWSWASVNAPVQIHDRIVAKRCYTIKNHEGAPLSFSDFKDKAINRDMQPQFAASDSLAVRGYLIPGRLYRQSVNGTFTFECAETGPAQRQNVIMDEDPPEALFKLFKFHLLPLVAQKTSDDETTYAGSALVLMSTHDYRRLTRSRLVEQVSYLVNSYKYDSQESKSYAARKTELQMLRWGVGALNACLHRVAKQDRDLPARDGNAFRRVGVVQFSDLAAEEWVKIRKDEERIIWLD